MSDDLERLRSIRQGGRTKGKARVRALSGEGKIRGFEVDYHDGRTAAVVRPQPIRAKISISGEETE